MVESRLAPTVSNGRPERPLREACRLSRVRMSIPPSGRAIVSRSAPPDESGHVEPTPPGRIPWLAGARYVFGFARCLTSATACLRLRRRATLRG